MIAAAAALPGLSRTAAALGCKLRRRRLSRHRGVGRAEGAGPGSPRGVGVSNGACSRGERSGAGGGAGSPACRVLSVLRVSPAGRPHRLTARCETCRGRSWQWFSPRTSKPQGLRNFRHVICRDLGFFECRLAENDQAALLFFLFSASTVKPLLETGFCFSSSAAAQPAAGAAERTVVFKGGSAARTQIQTTTKLILTPRSAREQGGWSTGVLVRIIVSVEN